MPPDPGGRPSGRPWVLFSCVALLAAPRVALSSSPPPLPPRGPPPSHTTPSPASLRLQAGPPLLLTPLRGTSASDQRLSLPLVSTLYSSSPLVFGSLALHRSAPPCPPPPGGAGPSGPASQAWRTDASGLFLQSSFFGSGTRAPPVSFVQPIFNGPGTRASPGVLRLPINGPGARAAPGFFPPAQLQRVRRPGDAGSLPDQSPLTVFMFYFLRFLPLLPPPFPPKKNGLSRLVSPYPRLPVSSAYSLIL